MPYHDEEYPGQPLWQSVLLFCCKGMIECIMIVLFFWLLVQVLFTKQLEVHLQVLLLVGLIIFCLTLVLGCVVCWMKTPICSGKDNTPTTSVQLPVDEPVTCAEDRHPSGETAASRHLYEELDGDTLEYPSTFTSPAQSHSEIFSQPFSDSTQSPYKEKEQATSYFSLRRFSSPMQTALYKPIHPGRASLPSLPSLPKLGLLTKTCKAMQRRCTVTGDSGCYDERRKLTINSQLMPGNLIPLTTLNYGSNADCKRSCSSKPYLHFTMAFSVELQTLTVTVLNLTGLPQKVEDVTVVGSLRPLHTGSTPATTLSRLSPESNSLELHLKVSSIDILQSCELRLAVYEQEILSTRGTALGEAEVKCGGRDWRAENPLHVMKELTFKNLNIEESLQSLNSQDSMGLSSPPRIFIGLQYQPQTNGVTATVFRGDNLQNLIHTSTAADYQVLINLYHEGVLISGRETSCESCTVWENASFLFDLPPGDISQLSVCLEFLIMQNQVFSGGRVVGRVLIGSEAANAGRSHWTDMYSLQMQQERWHVVQPERPFNA